MKKLFSMLLLCAAVVLASCSKDDPTPDPTPTPIAVAFSSLTANGSATETTTALTLTFDKAIEGLTAADITLTVGETQAVKGALTAKTNGVYELAVSGIAKGGEITVAAAKTGYAITPASKEVTVNYAAPAPTVAVGDFYYSDKTYSKTYNGAKTCIGVVFWVDPADVAKGKIVSLDEAILLRWSTEYVSIGATSDTDGADNTSKVLALSSYTAEIYPAFAWCATKNTSAPAGIIWYIPAKEELKALYGKYNGDTNIDNSVKTVVNASLSNVSGASELSTKWYWSSTQDKAGSAWSIDFNSGSVGALGKNSSSPTRVVSAF